MMVNKLDMSANELIVSFEDHSLKFNEAKDVECVIEKLKGCEHMTCLILRGNTLGIPAAEALGQQLKKHSSLSKCIFSDLFTGRLKTEIAPALEHLSNGMLAAKAKIVELDLSDNAFGPNGVVGVTKLLASPSCYTLKVLKMNNQGLGHAGCQKLVDALKQGREACDKKGLNLKVFWAGRNRLENYGAKQLASVFADMNSLEELVLYQNGIGIDGFDGVQTLMDALSHNRDLRVLNLSDNSLTPEGGEAVANLLPVFENLEALHLGDCILRSKGARYIATALEDPECLPNLQELNLSGNEIRRRVGTDIVLALANKENLVHVDISCNEFGPTGVREIYDTFVSLNLLHLVKPQSDSQEPDGDTEGDDSDEIDLEFFEDQGEDGETESESESDEYDDEEEEESEDDTEDHEEKAQATAHSFSFRSTMDALNTEIMTPTTKNNLFDSVSGACNFKNTLSPGAALFGTPSAKPQTGAVCKSDDVKISLLADLLRNQLTYTHQHSKIKNLYDECINQSSDTIQTAIASLQIGKAVHQNDMTPEGIVETALHLLIFKQKSDSSQMQNAKMTGVEMISDSLLLEALTLSDEKKPTDSTSVNECSANFNPFSISMSSRAANALLAQLGAIKRERSDSDSDSSLSDPESGQGDRVNRRDLPKPRRSFIELVRLQPAQKTACLAAVQRVIKQHKDKLPVNVANSLALLLMKCRETDCLSQDVTGSDKSTDLLVDDIVNNLQLKLGSISLNTKN